MQDLLGDLKLFEIFSLIVLLDMIMDSVLTFNLKFSANTSPVIIFL